MKNREVYQVTSIILCFFLLVMLYCSVRSEVRQIGYRDGQLAAYQAYNVARPTFDMRLPNHNEGMKKMKKQFRCKQSKIVFFAVGVCLLMPLFKDIVFHRETITIDGIATYLFLAFALFGLFVFVMASFHVVVTPRDIALRIGGIPIVIIDNDQIERVEPANRPAIHLLSLAKNQVFIQYNQYGERKINVALQNNDAFLEAATAAAGNALSNQDGALPGKCFKHIGIVRLLIAAVYVAINMMLSAGLASAWLHSAALVAMMCLANVIFVVMYMKSYSAS